MFLLTGIPWGFACEGGDTAGTLAVEDVEVRDGVEMTAVGATEFADKFAGVRLGAVVQEQLPVFVDETRR